MMEIVLELQLVQEWTTQTKIRIVDKAAPEVPEDTREYSVDIANNDRAEVWIPFSEPLYKESLNYLLMI